MLVGFAGDNELLTPSIVASLKGEHNKTIDYVMTRFFLKSTCKYSKSHYKHNCYVSSVFTVSRALAIIIIL